MFFADRREAGRQLADSLAHLRGAEPVVAAVPRGGVPVAARVAEALDAPLEVCLVRALRAPFPARPAVGAIGEGAVRLVARDVLREAGVTERELAEEEWRQRAVLDRMARMYRGGSQALDVAGRTVIVVDDGLASGFTARAACRAVRAHGAARVILALPVADYDKTPGLYQDADELVCMQSPRDLVSIGRSYLRFPEITDAEVITELEENAKRPRLVAAGGRDREQAASAAGHGLEERASSIAAGSARLVGRLCVPEDPIGAVIFAYGSGSGSAGARNRYVAQHLYRHHLATLMLDLLTDPEAIDRHAVFDIGLLGRRLLTAAAWLGQQPGLPRLPLGYFGSGTGAAAAVWAAAEPGSRVKALVLLAGRPDLAGTGRLASVTAPTLLLAGSRDAAVLDLNRRARARLRCESQLFVVPGADHAFEEPRALAVAARMAGDWFAGHLGRASTAAPARGRR